MSDPLGRPPAEIRAFLGKLEGLPGREDLQAKIDDNLSALRSQPELAAECPGSQHDRLFKSDYCHVSDGTSYEEGGCDGEQISRHRLDQKDPQVAVPFALIASGYTAMKSGTQRDDIAPREGIIAFEMEGIGVWDRSPCVVINGARDYANSHKTKVWQQFAAATKAACIKAFLTRWVPSRPFLPGN